MDQPTQSSARSTAALGLLTAAIGLFYMLLCAGLVPISAQPDNEEPRWLGIAFGMTFLFGGSAVVMQTIFGDGKATAQRALAAAPVWVRALYHALCVGIVVSLGAIRRGWHSDRARGRFPAAAPSWARPEGASPSASARR